MSGFCYSALRLEEGVPRGRSGRVGTITMCSWCCQCKSCCQPCWALGNQCQCCITRFPFLQGDDPDEVTLLPKRSQFSTRFPSLCSTSTLRCIIGSCVSCRVQASPSGYVGQPAGGVGNTCEMSCCLKILLNLEFRRSQLSCIHTEGSTLVGKGWEQLVSFNQRLKDTLFLILPYGQL